MGNEGYEPSASSRATGAVMYDIFQGLVQAGFTESQALQIIGNVVQASVFGDIVNGDGDGG